MTLQDREAGLTSTNYSDFVFVGSNSGTAGSSNEVSGRDLRPGGAFLLQHLIVAPAIHIITFSPLLRILIVPTLEFATSSDMQWAGD